MIIQINCDKKKTLYLDERQNRNPKKFKKKLGENYFFIGGIEISDSEKPFIVDFVRQFKNELYPEKKSSYWELKGYIKRDGLIDAQNKWIKWAEKLTESNNLNYKLHGSFIELSKYSKHHPEASESDVIKRAYKDAIKIFIEYQCGEYFENIFEVFPSEVIFDNIEGGQQKAFDEANEELKEKYSHLKQFGIFRGARSILNGDYDSEESLIMQFVDMQIFALTKFLAPTISALDGSENILVNFENYAHQLKTNTLPTDTQKLVEIVKFNGKINPLFHHLRHKILKINYDKNGELITSLSLTSDRTYQDFGSEADDMMFNFCNIFERREGKYYKMLNSIES